MSNISDPSWDIAPARAAALIESLADYQASRRPALEPLEPFPPYHLSAAAKRQWIGWKAHRKADRTKSFHAFSNQELDRIAALSRIHPMKEAVKIVLLARKDKPE